VRGAPDPGRDLLRHTLATMAYRGGKAVRGAPSEFGGFRISLGGASSRDATLGDASSRDAKGTRTPAAILAHVGDLMDWALELTRGRHTWKDSKPLPWEEEVARFFAAVRRLDEALASEPLLSPPEKIFQGPIADALTHVGQIAMLRRIAGVPMRGENYYKADIAAGRVGPEQTPPRVEFE
jgi:hypothetical protein